jgi:hypothetical protein
MSEGRSRARSPLSRFSGDIGIRLISLMLLLALLPMLGLGIVGRSSLQSSLLSSRTEALDAVNDTTAGTLDSLLTSAQTLVDFAAQSDQIVLYSSNTGTDRFQYATGAVNQLRQLVRQNPSFELAGLVDPSGLVLLDAASAGLGNEEGVSLSGQEFFTAAVDGRSFISVPAFNTATQQSVFYISTPVYQVGQTNRVVGVVRLRVNGASLQTVLDSRLAQGDDRAQQGLNLALVDSRGRVRHWSMGNCG